MTEIDRPRPKPIATMLWVALLLGTAPLYGYVVIALVLGAIPANRDWQAPVQGVRLYVTDNGVHTAIVMPANAEGVDWRDLAEPQDIRDSRYAALGHVAIGWGDRDFYVDTPTWAEFRIATALNAAFGSRTTVVHVAHVRAPAPGKGVRSVVLRPEEYRRLAAFVRATFAGSRASRPGYWPNDAFYEGRGTYSAIRTCNAWTGEAFRKAGVRMGLWTPFPSTVMTWL